MKVTICRPGHERFFRPQKAQTNEWYFMLANDFFRPEICDHAYTAWSDDRVIAMAGIARRYENQGLAWALLSENLRRSAVPLVRIMRRVVAAYPLPRVEAWVDPNFGDSLRLVQALGMVRDDAAPPPKGFDGRALRVFKRPNDDGHRNFYSR